MKHPATDADRRDSETLVRVRVVDPSFVVDGGRQAIKGETLTVPAYFAADLIARGLVELL